jgi:cyclopropane-fatty-acyl-phospholipid synthase
MSTVDIAFRMHMPTGAVEVQGSGNPAFDLYLKNDRGVKAFRSMHELTIAEAYVRGDIEIEGDAIKAMWLRDTLSDRNAWLKL